jgi:hypothetical protein
VSDQERMDNEEQQSEEQVQDLDVAEEQQDDVMGGRMGLPRDDRKK